MAWYGDILILLPQYPDRFGDQANGELFAIPRQEILDFLDGKSQAPIKPSTITFYAPGLPERIQGFEGYEAIAFLGDRVYLTIEARPRNMLGYLIAGYILPDSNEIRLETAKLVEIPPQAGMDNMSDEALVVFGDRLVTLYEANGDRVNNSPLAHLFDANLRLIDNLAFPSLEYRITDATDSDEFGRFWAINYFFPGDLILHTNKDTLAEQFGRGASHARSSIVERLIQFQFSEAGIVFGEANPVQLELSSTNEARNWEAIARLAGHGFLIATDKFPRTILGFVPALP